MLLHEKDKARKFDRHVSFCQLKRAGTCGCRKAKFCWCLCIVSFGNLKGNLALFFFSIIEKEKEKEEKIFRKVVWVWKSKSKRSKTGVRKEPEEVNLQCNTTILCDSVIATNGEKMHE